MTWMRYPAWLRRRRRGAPDTSGTAVLAAALVDRDEERMRALLHPDVVLVIDGGGVVSAPAAAVQGSADAALELTALMSPGTTVRTASINGASGLLLVRDLRVVAAVTVETTRRRISRVWVVCNPEKLRFWNR
jgi:RNA polymerase sigma-70 factor (ECF subfamily)